MPLEKSEAIILKTFNWSESSRAVHFFTEKFGRMPLMDRAGRSVKSKRGRLLPFARLEITFYVSEKESTGYLSDSDLIELFSFEKEGTLGRLAYGSAACELLYRLLPEQEPLPDLYTYLMSYLRYIDRSDRRFLPALFLAFFLRLLSQLGYHPSIEYCVVCGQEVSEFIGEGKTVAFSPERGGIVSPACQKPGEYYIDLTLADHRRLMTLQRASLHEAASIAVGYQEAVRLIDALAKFLSYQADIKSELKSLEFLEKLKGSQLNG
jgi:DNA repair protein RecO (recombination protein O)